MKNFMMLVTVGSIAAVGSCSGIYAHTTDEVVQFTVKDKERVVESSQEGTKSYYLIYTDNGEYKNEDSLWYLKWDSASVYGQLERGKTYEAHVYGFRLGFLSMYPNIVSVEELHEGKT